MPPATSWQESLAYIFAYENEGERDALIKALGDTLLKMRNVSAGIVCYIISKSIGEVLDLWKQRALFQIKKQEKTREQALFELFQRYILFKLAIEGSSSRRHQEFDQNEDYNNVLADISRYLTSQTDLATLALKYLSFSSGPTDEVLCLKDRIFNSNFSTFNGRVAKPIAPFQVERLRVQIPQLRQQVNQGRGAAPIQQVSRGAQPYPGQQQFNQAQQPRSQQVNPNQQPVAQNIDQPISRQPV